VANTPTEFIDIYRKHRNAFLIYGAKHFPLDIFQVKAAYRELMKMIFSRFYNNPSGKMPDKISSYVLSVGSYYLLKQLLESGEETADDVLINRKENTFSLSDSKKANREKFDRAYSKLNPEYQENLRQYYMQSSSGATRLQALAELDQQIQSAG
jgi:hypothetical protein